MTAMQTDATSDRFRGLWELAVLSLLREMPMHPYQMQRLLAERHKDELLALKRGSLYHAIHRLERAGLIEEAGTGREGRRPERTTYRITAQGEREQVRWLRRLIATPRRETSEFTASISFLVYLKRDDATAQLELRAGALGAEIAALESMLKAAGDRVGRINLLETEYAVAMRKAELAWVRSLLDELRTGRLDWDIDAILGQLRAARGGMAEERSERQ
jgi:DNA-binding PadR family transcriptional regulator